MPKRKVSVGSEEESNGEDSSHSDSDEAPVSNNKSSKNSKKASAPTIKKPKFNTSNELTTKQEQPVLPNKDNQETKILVNANGEKFIDLGKKKRAVVRLFKGIPLLDIREFYGTPGEEKPGKRGISLTLDQWKALSAGADTIDDLFAQQKKS